MKRWGVVIALFTVFAAFGQKSAEIRELESRRKAALAEIEMTSQLLSETKESAQSSLNRLNLIARQIQQRREIITLLTLEVAVIDNNIRKIREEINLLETELRGKRDGYEQSVRQLFKRRKLQDKLLFILSADNFSQSLRRIRYLREYTDWQKRQAAGILEKQKEIKAQWELLEKTRGEKQGVLQAREAENSRLAMEENAQKQTIDGLNRKQRQLQAELKKKQQQAEALNRQIEKQIAAEVARTRKKAESKDASPEDKRVAETQGGYAMTKDEKLLAGNFAANRGSLPIPVTGNYSIVGVYGEQQHQSLKYVRFFNNGIDIRATAGADARAVFGGVVSKVFVQPGYNNSIIVRHGNYLTVYSNLIDVYVKQGDKVQIRQVLGKIFTDSDNDNATILHFELWKETDKQNPRPWLTQ
ncbi:MAG: peptidoglycan DD-metalloendopeptidase family [Bacteroidales bacterium]